MLKSVTELPFNRHIGIQKSSSVDALLELPPGEQYLNHLGTIHAGAQLALAEACSGEFLLNHFAVYPSPHSVVRRVDAKFKKAANGRLVAKVITESDAMERAKAEVEGRGRCLVTISVELYDETNQHSLTASFEWYVALAVAE